MTFAVGLAVALVLGGLAAWWKPLPRSNFRGRTVSLAGGLAAVVTVAIGARTIALLVAVLGAGAVGLYDDLFGTHQAKGLAGHLRALLRGRITTGVVKLAVVASSALAAALLLHGVHPRALLDTVLIAGSANLLNLFDLRPGRALKVALVAAAAARAGWLAGTCLGLLPYDLRERTMLGDTGANALGAALGVTVARHSLAVVVPVTVAVVAMTLVSERVSFSRVIDAVRPLRWADRLGRTA